MDANAAMPTSSNAKLSDAMWWSTMYSSVCAFSAFATWNVDESPTTSGPLYGTEYGHSRPTRTEQRHEEWCPSPVCGELTGVEVDGIVSAITGTHPVARLGGEHLVERHRGSGDPIGPVQLQHVSFDQLVVPMNPTYSMPTPSISNCH